MLTYLNDLGHVITSFIDDSLLVGQMVEEVWENVKDTVKIFDSLGFVVHDEKSQFSPLTGDILLWVCFEFLLHDHDHGGTKRENLSCVC